MYSSDRVQILRLKVKGTCSMLWITHKARNLGITENDSELSYITPLNAHLEYNICTHVSTKVQTNTHSI